MKGLNAVVALCMLSFCACSKSDFRTETAQELSADSTFARMDHGGIKIGANLDPISLPCADSISRTIAPSKGRQLVTFLTAGDCSECHAHLAGLRLAAEEALITTPQLYVVYTTPLEIRQSWRAARSIAAAPVCFDVQGALWSKYNVVHSPVTALVSDGNVVLIHDQPLLKLESRKRLARALDAWRSHASAAIPNKPGR
jgi:hypothetical protein